jgi:hypothetical protein
MHQSWGFPTSRAPRQDRNVDVEVLDRYARGKATIESPRYEPFILYWTFRRAEISARRSLIQRPAVDRESSFAGAARSTVVIDPDILGPSGQWVIGK